MFWSALRLWGERALAVGVLTIEDIRNGDPTACTLLLAADPLDGVRCEGHERPTAPVAPVVLSSHTPQQKLEQVMARAIAMRRRG